MARSHDDARDEDSPAPASDEGGAILARLVKLDEELRRGSGALGQAPGDGLCAALEELIEKHTQHQRQVAPAPASDV